MIESQPLYLGEPDAPVFGVVTRHDEQTSGPAVLIVPPLAFENVGSYRPLRTLAQTLAADGCVVLRFDWLGCGDSSDAAPTADGVARWTDAVATAARALSQHAGVPDITLVGLRIGATLALVTAAAADVPVSDIALLAPYVSGKSYLRELRAYQALTERSQVAEEERAAWLPEGWVESNGFVFSPQEAAVLNTVDLRELDLSQSRLRRALFVPSPAFPHTEALVGLLGGAGVETAVESLPGLVFSYDDPARSALPRSSAEAVSTWVRARQDSCDGGTLDPWSDPAPVSIQAAEQMTVREQPVALGPPGARLLGVTCEPMGQDHAGRPWIVFLNAGAVRRSGPNRLWTTYARHWAAHGVPSLRLDVRGVGDSDGDTGIDEAPGEHYDVLYAVEALEDVRTALTWLRESRGARSFATIGLCSGGFLGFHAALTANDVTSVTLVNPQTLYWNPEDSSLRALDYVRVALGRPQTWLRIFTRRGAAMTGKALRGFGNAVLGRAGLTNASSTGERIASALAGLRGKGTAVHFVFAAENLGLAYLRRHLGADFQAVIEQHGGTITVVPGPDHTFTPVWSHDVLRQVLEQHFPAGGVVLDTLPTRG